MTQKDKQEMTTYYKKRIELSVDKTDKKFWEKQLKELYGGTE